MSDEITSAFPPDGADDPYLWLEEIEGERAVAWVEAENKRSAAFLHDDDFAADREAALTILDADDKIPFPAKVGDHLYNFWRDAKNPRGVWRRTTEASYRTSSPVWENLLDIDALNTTENVAWAFGGATLSPDRMRALVSLSFDGTDAVEIREFDIETKTFVAGGFLIPKAKGGAAWLDRDTLLFNSALTPEHTTEAGYGRVVRRLSRGQSVEAGETVFEIGKDDMGVWFDVNHRPGSERITYSRMIDFTRMETWVEPKGGARAKLDLPDECAVSCAAQLLTVSPKKDWTVGGTTIKSGALAAIDLARFMAGARDFQIVFEPSPTRALENWIETRHGIVLQVLDNVQTSVLHATCKENAWSLAPVAGLPENAAIHVSNFGGENDPDLGADVLMVVTSFTLPSSLMLWDGVSAPETLRSGMARFDATGMEVVQRFAKAADGEKIPYFVIGKDLSGRAKPRPTILNAYGGFEISSTPTYGALNGKLWLERGHIFVVANIRGGGEFGPRWHEAARRATKHVSHDDFAAVAKDLIASGITDAKHLACEGGSNGGLLVGNMLTRYPELFGAVWCIVPLLDMARYTKLLAGHSWIAEYGDPDDAKEWEFIQRFSPYHLVEGGRPYPPVFLTTNRTDDRVHPGHARKMAAKLREFGYPVWFNETVEGGHSGAVDNRKIAESQALGFAFLRKTIGKSEA